MKRQRPKIGDVFSVELSDGHYATGQVVGREREVLNSITCAFFNAKLAEPTTGLDFAGALISCLFVTADLLNRGKWKITGNEPTAVAQKDQPYEQFRSNGWVGAKMIGSGNVKEFLNAYHGLCYWDDWHDPTYLDSLLIDPSAKPKALKLKAEQDGDDQPAAALDSKAK